MRCKNYLFLLCCILALSVNLFAGEFKIIVNNTSDIQSISKTKLRNNFVGKQSKWQNGQRIYPVILSEGTVRETFITEIVKKTPIAYKNYWNTILYTGRGVPPTDFSSDEKLIQYVQSHQNTIGIISQETITANVKVIELVE